MLELEAKRGNSDTSDTTTITSPGITWSLHIANNMQVAYSECLSVSRLTQKNVLNKQAFYCSFITTAIC